MSSEDRELPEVGETVRLTRGYNESWDGARIHIDGRAYSPTFGDEYAYGHDVEDPDRRSTSVNRGEWEPLS